MEDRRCRLGLGGRRELVRLIEEGQSLRAAARRLGVAPATAHRWWHRWLQAGQAGPSSGACLRSRPPRPRSCPWRLSLEQEQAILAARERTNLGPARLAGLVGRRRSTIWKVLHRHGVSRRRRSPRPEHPGRRYEWSEPGALLHIDTKQLARFHRPGHFAHGARAEAYRSRGAGYGFAHCVVDDHSRLAYVELQPDQRGETCAAVLVRAIAWMAEQGCGPTRAVMSDNARSYTTSRAFLQALAGAGARQILIPPRTPRWNGKTLLCQAIGGPRVVSAQASIRRYTTLARWRCRARRASRLVLPSACLRAMKARPTGSSRACTRRSGRGRR